MLHRCCTNLFLFFEFHLTLTGLKFLICMSRWLQTTNKWTKKKKKEKPSHENTHKHSFPRIIRYFIISVLLRSPSIMSFKVRVMFSLTSSNHQEENVFQNIYAWEHSNKRWCSSFFEESQKVHLSFNDKPILKSFAFVYNI